ncbi:hypothetical protein LI140_02980 [Phocaeicola dorei]|uniref:hypothetical protein n=1 Tax=Phocaeicola dorei TaxID=357276 RepID=UPI001C390D39|nr:hypothetical protein [Phocaeicola dorei]MBV4238640.1 hypothetical protein [Phocaeicola dorei]MCB6461217.1 hypothetical protein [Phocaeicola dorei]MCB6746590.1 hypothetical protein [Phocaeicola dorei]MCB6772000.1 hypothetical protein [Phocaeicola dorei]MCB6790790.1 hypothetical protein [Phocaeicola dorei]
MGRNSLFDTWFVYNYQRLRNVFGRFLNEDAFHDAYLVMKREIMLSEVVTENFEPYFFGVYKKCRLRCIHKDSRYYFPDDEHFFLLMEEEEGPSVKILAASDKLVYDILLFVKKKYPQTDYELFRLKEYEAKCSYRNLSAYAGISASAIHKRISDIVDVIRNHKGFSKRYVQINI